MRSNFPTRKRAGTITKKTGQPMAGSSIAVQASLCGLTMGDKKNDHASSTLECRAAPGKPVGFAIWTASQQARDLWLNASCGRNRPDLARAGSISRCRFRSPQSFTRLHAPLSLSFWPRLCASARLLHLLSPAAQALYSIGSCRLGDPTERHSRGRRGRLRKRRLRPSFTGAVGRMSGWASSVTPFDRRGPTNLFRSWETSRAGGKSVRSQRLAYRRIRLHRCDDSRRENFEAELGPTVSH